jgi:GNAT superfamily N-acetyltransferase
MSPRQTSLQLHPVRSASERRRFVDLPRRFPGFDPKSFVPPLTMDLVRRLDAERHPFFAHAEAGFWLATRGGRDVGRVSATVDQLSLDRHQDGVGFFGHILAEDQDVADALLEQARAYLRERGCERMRGPVELSTNYTCGLQVSHFDVMPMIDMNQHPPGQEELLLAAGLEGVQDLLAFRIHDQDLQLERLDRLAKIAERRAPATLRLLDLSRFEEDCRSLHRIYEQAWADNYGFVPMTWDEFAYAAKDFRKIVDPATCILAEQEGEVIGFALGLPDANQAIRACNGRVLPFGWIPLLWTLKRLRQIRVITLGIVPSHRARGFDARLILELTRSGLSKGYNAAELSWVLEQNVPMIKPLLEIGAKESTRYRLYELPL